MTHDASGARIARDLLADGFGRIRDGVDAVIGGLSVPELLWRPDPDANHIGWLVWHLTRQQDEQIAQLLAVPSVWASSDWPERLALPYRRAAHGYGMSSQDVGSFTLTDPEMLSGYHSACHDLTLRLIEALGPADYARVVDESWDPPVTMAIRLVSVLEDAEKHLGQAEYVRGMVERRR